MRTNWGTGSSVWTWGKTSSLWGWRSTGTGCPGRLWSLLLWRYARPAWTRSSAACCRWSYFGRRVGLDDPQRSLKTPTILWLCDSVILWFCFIPTAPFGSDTLLTWLDISLDISLTSTRNWGVHETLLEKKWVQVLRFSLTVSYCFECHMESLIQSRWLNPHV